MKKKLLIEGSEVYEKIVRLKMLAEDGKLRETDVADTETEQAKGLHQNAIASKKGGAVAKNARKELEAKTGKSVVTGENFLPPSKNKKKLK